MSEQYGVGRDGSVHPHGARPGGRDPRHLPHGLHGRTIRPAGCRSASSARTAARSARPRPATGTAQTVAYDCRPTSSSGHAAAASRGRVAPFGGRAKLVWNVDWAARWGLSGVTIEGCGKDLATAGGSRDRADAISRRVFEREPPLNMPYEFLNIGGRKMSTSQGRRRGRPRDRRAAAARAAALPVPAPPAQPRHQLRPGGDTIPRLFDEFDRIADAVAGRPRAASCRPTRSASSRLSLADPDADIARRPARFRPPFRHLALLVQVPGPDVQERLDGREGRAARRRGAGRSRSQRIARRHGLAASVRARPGAPGHPLRRACRQRRRPDRGPARLPARIWPPPPRRPTPLAAKPGRSSSSTPPRQPSLPAGQAFGAHLSGVPGPRQRAARGLAAGVVSIRRS